MKYKVGDKVRVRKDLEVGKDYDNVYNFNNDMAEMRGKTVTIEKKYDDCYWLKETSCWWTDEMLEPIEDIIEYKGKKYDVKTSRKDFNNDVLFICKEHKDTKDIEELTYKYLNTYGNISQHRKSEEPLIDKINELVRIINENNKKM